MSDVDLPDTSMDNEGEYIKINKKDIKPLYDTAHTHAFLPTEEESDIPGTEVRKCQFCPVGVYVSIDPSGAHPR